MTKSIEFKWDNKKIIEDIELAKLDEAVQLSLKFLNNKTGSKILEAGCGNGRVVKYFFDLGYKNIEGIELNQEIVLHINSIFPELNIYQGDLIEYNFKSKYDFIVS